MMQYFSCLQKETDINNCVKKYDLVLFLMCIISYQNMASFNRSDAATCLNVVDEEVYLDEFVDYHSFPSYSCRKLQQLRQITMKKNSRR